MPAAQIQCDLREGEKRKRGEFVETHHGMPDGKLIATMQVCLHCKKTFPPRRGRRCCPQCEGILRNKTIVLKIP